MNCIVVTYRKTGFDFLTSTNVIWYLDMGGY